MGHKIEEIEALIKAAHAGHEAKTPVSAASTPKEERKDVAVLQKQLDDLQKEKQAKIFEHQSHMNAYLAQQSQILTGEWIAKKKAQLLKKRIKEAGAIKADKEKCEKLIEDCEKIAEQFSQINSAEETKKVVSTDPPKSAKEKKKKKKKKKKAETLIGALGLDTLREQFEYFSISAPKKKEDLPAAIHQLNSKLGEIKSRRLTEVIGEEENTTPNASESLSTSSLSLSSEH